MGDFRRAPDLFDVLRQLAIVSAALNHNPSNRKELLAHRDLLVKAAQQMGFAITDEQQERLQERLGSRPTHTPITARMTRDHEEIVAWALEHNAVPAEVRRPVFDRQPSALRFLSGEARAGTPELSPISWESFFAQFDLMGLAIIFDDEVDDYEIVSAPPTPTRPPN